MTITTGTAIAILGAAIAAAFCGIGSAIGTGLAGKAAAGVTAESPDKYSKVLPLQVLPGSQGIYGLVTAFLLFSKIKLFGTASLLSIQQGLLLFFACLPIAIVGFISAIYQAKVAISGIMMVGKRPEESGKAITFCIMVETYAILALFISLFAILIPKI